MSTPTTKPVALRACPPHTAAKHALLERYLGAWFPIMARYNKRVVYYDAFAGPGEYEDGRPGSPVIALQTLLDHTATETLAGTEFVFLFNEADETCAAHLTQLVDDLKAKYQPWPTNVVVEVENATFVDLTTKILDDISSKNAELAPTFAFIDPVGVSATPMAVLKRLGAHEKSELLVYFANEAAVRFGASGMIDDAFLALFGTDAFTATKAEIDGPRSDYLHDLYKQQLHQECSYPYIQSFTMYDKRGKRLYDLFYCTRNPTGMKRMKEAMWKVAPSGDFTFRDRFADQEVLFADTVNTEPLRQHLQAHFRGQSVDITTIINHVVTETPYLESHVKALTLKPMQVDGLIESPNQRRRGQFPDGTIITFGA